MPRVTAETMRGVYLLGDGAGAERPLFRGPGSFLARSDNLVPQESGYLAGRRGTAVRSTFTKPVASIARLYPRGRSESGPRFPSTILEDASNGGTAVWADLANVALPDDQFAFATFTPADLLTPYLDAGGFGFALPLSASIQGITVGIMRRGLFLPAPAIRDEEVRLSIVDLGTPFVSENRAETALNWPWEAPDWRFYGGATDLWGLVPNPIVLGQPDFTVRLSARVASVSFGSAAGEVYGVRVSVYYRDPSAVAKTLVATRDAATLTYHHETAPFVFSTLIPTVPALERPDVRPRAVPWPEKSSVYLFDGVNPVLRYNGEFSLHQVFESLAGTSARRGPFATLHQDRLFASDPDEDDFSIYASEPFRDDLWREDAHLSVSDEGGRITGLVSFAGRLIALKENSTWSFAGDVVFGGDLLRVESRGCVAPDSVAVTPFGVIYVSHDGVYLTSGSGPATELSRPLRPLFEGRTERQTFNEAVGIYYARRQQYWVQLDPTVAEIWVGSRLVSQEEGPTVAWARFPGLSFTAGELYAGSGEPGTLILGRENGGLVEHDVGSSDDGAAITCVARSLPVDFQRRSQTLGRVSQLFARVRTDGAAPLTWRLYFDQADTAGDVGTFDTAATAQVRELRRFIANMALFGRQIAWELQADGGPDVEIHRVELETALRGARVHR